VVAKGETVEQVLGSRYVLHERLGRGGMGTVFRASRRDGGADSAVKVLRGDLADDPNIVARFVQERSIMLELRSDHLVQVEDLVVDDGSVAIVMELVDGGNLRTYLKRHGSVGPTVALEFIEQVLDGLTTVHAAGIIHRDLKPENILLTTDGARAMLVKVTDFGIARVASNRHLTSSSQYLGTPHYAAPELFDDIPASPATDIYAVGIVLYELLSGATPYAGETPLSVMRKQATSAPTKPAGVDGVLWELLRRWLAPSPAQRPVDASAALRELRAVQTLLNGQPSSAPGDSPAVQPNGTNPVKPGFVPPAPPEAPEPDASAPSGASGWSLSGDPDFDPNNQWFPTSAGPGFRGFPAPAAGFGASFAPPGVPGPAPEQFPPVVPQQFNPYADEVNTPSLVGTPLRDDATRQKARAPRASSQLPSLPAPTRNRTQLWILLAVATVLLAVIGTGVYLVASNVPSKDPRLSFGVERYPQSGAEVTRTWELVGKNGNSVKGTLVVLLTKGGPVDLDEVLPLSMVGANPSITPIPAADTIKPGPDPVFRYHLQGTPGQRVTASYVTSVPAGPRTVGRLQEWATARNAAAAAYWQEKHQLSQLSVDPATVQLRLPGPPQHLTLSGKASDGSVAPTVAVNGAVWKSADPGVAEVDSNGWVTPIGGGTTQVIAMVGKATTTATVTVTAAPISIAPATCQPIRGDAPTATVSGTTATVRWSPLALPHCTLANYIVTASPSNNSQTVSPGSTSYDFTSLAPGTYQFTVIADFGKDGQSPVSPPSDSVTINCDTVAPPSDLSARPDASGSGSVTVSWTNPTVAAGCDGPTSYVVEQDGNDATTASSDATSTSLESVPGGHHTINVVGVLANGKRIPGSGTSVDVPLDPSTNDPSAVPSSGG
jgi:serine/threonine protein kinase